MAKDRENPPPIGQPSRPAGAGPGCDKGDKTVVRCPGCGIVGHVHHNSPTTARGDVIMEGRRMTYNELPEVYMYPGPDRGKVEPSAETKSKMASPELQWSKASYSMESLMARYSNHFPIIVKVSRGYYGKHDMDTLASSQVARLHTWGMQERVLARISKGRQISIPLDYEINFEVLEKNNKKKKLKEKKLKTIIKEHELPVRVRFHKKAKWNFRIGAEKYYTKDFGEIEILKVYTQRFLKGNTIHHGIIDTKVMLVPMYVNVTFKVAIGAKGQTNEEWEALQTMYSNAVAHINFDAIKGTKDMTEYPSELEPKDKQKELTDDELEDDVVDGTDANANLMSVTDRETNKTHLNGDVRTNGNHVNSDNRGEILSMPVRKNLLMQVTKQDLEHRHINGGGSRIELEPVRSEFSDYSSFSGDRSGYQKQNVVHVSLGGDAQVITHEMYDQDFGHGGLIMRQPRPSRPSSSHGSTIINVTNDEAEILSPGLQPAYYNSMSRSETNLRRTFSDTDFHDNSVFLSNSMQPEEFPSYATRRRYRPSYPSFSAVDVNRVPRYGRKKYGQVIHGGAPVEERRYHSMKDLSRIDTVDSGVSRAASFRSVTMTPSAGPPRQKHQNLYVRLRDEQPQDRYIKRIEFRDEGPVNPVTYTRRAGMDRATKVATQVRSRDRAVNQGVYFTDGYQNYPVRSKHPPRHDPPTFAESTDFVEVIEEDFSHSEPLPPPMQSPVLSSSSNEDSKRYFIMYDNGSNEVPVVTEAMENGEEFIYQGSMMLRKGRDFEQLSVGDESMIDIPIEDFRYPSRGRSFYSSSHDDTIPIHDLRSNQRVSHSYITRRQHERPVHGSRIESSSEVRRVAYDEVDAEEDYDEGFQHVDMTKGAAEHFGRVMDLSTSPTSRHSVPIEFEGKSSRGIIESMFEGGHHSHSFTGRDRNVCHRLEQHRQDRSNRHRELSLRRDRQARHYPLGRTSHSHVTTTSGVNVRGPGIHSSYSGRSGSNAAAARSSSFEFRTNRNEVWSGDSQSFGVAPLTTSEQETTALLEEVEAMQSKLNSNGYKVPTTELNGDTKGSTSSYSDSELSSQSGGEMNGDRGRSYDLAGLDDDYQEVETSHEPAPSKDVPLTNGNDSAGPAANAAAAAMADGHLDIHGDQRISRKTARELTRTGSVRSLREVYARSRSPSSSQRDKPRMAVAAATEVFADILNKPTTSGTNGAIEQTTIVTETKTTTSQDGNVVLRSKTGRTSTAAVPSGSRGTVASGSGRQADQDLAWQETQSYHLESIRDSIRDLDEYLKNQGGESDSHSLSSAASSKHLEHFSYALTDPTTY